MKFAELMFRAVFYIPNWVYGKETMLRVLFMYLMINAMHKAHVAATTLEA